MKKIINILTYAILKKSKMSLVGYCKSGKTLFSFKIIEKLEKIGFIVTYIDMSSDEYKDKTFDQITEFYNNSHLIIFDNLISPRNVEISNKNSSILCLFSTRPSLTNNITTVISSYLKYDMYQNIIMNITNKNKNTFNVHIIKNRFIYYFTQTDFKIRL